jgi:hypothetical protein
MWAADLGLRLSPPFCYETPLLSRDVSANKDFAPPPTAMRFGAVLPNAN